MGPLVSFRACRPLLFWARLVSQWELHALSSLPSPISTLWGFPPVWAESSHFCLLLPRHQSLDQMLSTCHLGSARWPLCSSCCFSPCSLHIPHAASLVPCPEPKPGPLFLLLYLINSSPSRNWDHRSSLSPQVSGTLKGLVGFRNPPESKTAPVCGFSA